MKILTDTHTHTNASTHAYSSLKENIEIAAEKGLELVAMTNHAPSLPDAPHKWHFQAMAGVVPRRINGVIVLKGVETSVVDSEGNLDLPKDLLKNMEVVIASLHAPVFPPRTKEIHTKTWMAIMDNPFVDTIGHSGSEEYDYDYEPVIRAAKEKNKCIEINNHSFDARNGAKERCREIALMCKKVGANIVVNSDAHICYDIGTFDQAVQMLKDIDFPEELIMNTTAEKYIKYIENKKGIKIL